MLSVYICVLCHSPCFLNDFFQCIVIFKRKSFMKSAETVINWTPGKVLAPHRACPPATASVTGDVALLLRVPVCPWPHWNLAAEGILLYGYFFFLFKDSPRGQAETVISPKLEHISQMWFSVADSTNQTRWSWHWLLNVVIGWDWAKTSYDV